MPGSAYPWHAVRRFVHENQGLMKRMYGDIRQISVLKNEFDGNYLETDEFEAASERYSEKRFRAMKFSKDQEQRPSQLNKKNRKSDTIMEPHFRLQSTSSTTSTTTTTPKSTSKTTIELPNINNVTTKKPTAYSNAKDYYLLTSNDTAIIDFEIETNKLNIGNESETFNEQDSVTVVTLSSNPNSITNESESLSITKKILSQEQQHGSTTEVSLDHLSSHESYSGSESGEASYEHEDEFDGHVSIEEEEGENVSPTMKGQLFQDTVQKPEPSPPLNVRGV